MCERRLPHALLLDAVPQRPHRPLGSPVEQQADGERHGQRYRWTGWCVTCSIRDDALCSSSVPRRDQARAPRRSPRRSSAGCRPSGCGRHPPAWSRSRRRRTARARSRACGSRLVEVDLDAPLDVRDLCHAATSPLRLPACSQRRLGTRCMAAESLAKCRVPATLRSLGFDPDVN